MPPRRPKTKICIAALCCAALAAPASADAARLWTGSPDPGYNFADQRPALMDGAVEAATTYARLVASWHTSAPTEPADRRDVSGYRWTALDAAVRDAADRGLVPVLTLFDAPPWAREPADPGYPFNHEPGAWKPDPAALADYAHVLAVRYNGDFPDPLRPGESLPRVRHYQVWNEANLGVFFAPQWEDGEPVSPGRYRQMLNLAYTQVHAVNDANLVVVAGTGPYGDGRNGWRMRPLAWWRAFLCLKNDLRPKRGRCTKPKFDIADHHPIGSGRAPTRRAVHPDDATVGDYGELRAIVRAAERHHTIATPGRHPLWASEIWWETKPDPEGISLPKQAKFIAQALYILQRSGAEAVFNFQIRDSGEPPKQHRSIQGGLFTASGNPKPALAAFRFPFWAERLSRRKVRLWAVPPTDGRVLFQRRAASGWRGVGSREATARQVITLTIRRAGRLSFRARIGPDNARTVRVGR